MKSILLGASRDPEAGVSAPPSRHARCVALPFTGQLRTPVAPTSAIVVGAGLAAAVVLAERGVQVTVLERERFTGGRAGAWADQLKDGTRTRTRDDVAHMRFSVDVSDLAQLRRALAAVKQVSGVIRAARG